MRMTMEIVEKEITISGADPSVESAIDLDEYSGIIHRIKVVRTAVAGTAYTSDSRTFELMESSGAATEGIDSIVKFDGLEPDGTTGYLINHEQEHPFMNTDYPNEKKIYAVMTASGGDATSSETYTVRIYYEPMGRR